MEEEPELKFLKKAIRYMLYAGSEIILVMSGVGMAIILISKEFDKWYIFPILMGSIFLAVLIRFISDELKDVSIEY